MRGGVFRDDPRPGTREIAFTCWLRWWRRAKLEQRQEPPTTTTSRKMRECRRTRRRVAFRRWPLFFTLRGPGRKDTRCVPRSDGHGTSAPWAENRTRAEVRERTPGQRYASHRPMRTHVGARPVACQPCHATIHTSLTPLLPKLPTAQSLDTAHAYARRLPDT